MPTMIHSGKFTYVNATSPHFSRNVRPVSEFPMPLLSRIQKSTSKMPNVISEAAASSSSTKYRNGGYQPRMENMSTLSRNSASEKKSPNTKNENDGKDTMDWCLKSAYRLSLTSR
jgi:hypothetical protein